MQTAHANNLDKSNRSKIRSKAVFYKRLDGSFEKIAQVTSRIVGSASWFVFSLLVIIAWIPSKSLFKTDELWHLFINTFTTILTFLMMALLHSSQSRWEEKIERLEKKQAESINKVNKEVKKTSVKLEQGQENTQKKKKNSYVKVDDAKSVQITSLL